MYRGAGGGRGGSSASTRRGGLRRALRKSGGGGGGPGRGRGSRGQHGGAVGGLRAWRAVSAGAEKGRAEQLDGEEGGHAQCRLRRGAEKGQQMTDNKKLSHNSNGSEL